MKERIAEAEKRNVISGVINSKYCDERLIIVEIRKGTKLGKVIIGKGRLGVKKKQVKINRRRGREAKKREKEIRCLFVGLIRFKRIYRFPTSFYYHCSASSALAFARPFLKTHHFFHSLLIPSHLLFFFFFCFIYILVHPLIEHSAL